MAEHFGPWPDYAPDEIEAVTAVLRAGKVNYWTGREGRLFEQEFAAYTGCAHAVALANGTVALDLALHALQVAPGDEIIVTPRTFVASASCIVNAKAIPVFAEVDAETQNITADSIAKVMTAKTKGVICVHLAGWPCDMSPILALAKTHGWFVLEDCAQAHGARYKGQPVGSFGDIGVFSFCQDKIMSTGGEGGMLVTQDKTLWERAWSYKDHGKSRRAVFEQPHPPGFRWLHHNFGTNWRLTEMQSAIGRLQLRKLDQWRELRAQHAQQIDAVCRDFACLRTPTVPADMHHAYYRYYVFVVEERLQPGWSRDRIIAQIDRQQAGYCFSGSCSEVYLEASFQNSGYQPKVRLRVAKILGETSLAFLTHPTLTVHDLARMTTILREVLSEASQ